jgi:hypothetical protein
LLLFLVCPLSSFSTFGGPAKFRHSNDFLETQTTMPHLSSLRASAGLLLSFALASILAGLSGGSRATRQQRTFKSDQVTV